MCQIFYWIKVNNRQEVILHVKINQKHRIKLFYLELYFGKKIVHIPDKVLRYLTKSIFSKTKLETKKCHTTFSTFFRFVE